jgi:ERF superfamily
MEEKIIQLTLEVKDIRTAMEMLYKQSNYISETLDKVNERFNAMGKFMAENNKSILAKLEPASEEPMSSEAQDQLFGALAKAKAKMNPDFEKTGSSNRGAYATYADLVIHARPLLAEEGLDIIHEPIERGNEDYLKTTIIHSSGQWRSSMCALRPDYEKAGPALQAYGSALTSMKRYVYAAILNLHTGGDKE